MCISFLHYVHIHVSIKPTKKLRGNLMNPEYEHYDTNRNNWHLEEYLRLITEFKTNRKNHISMADLCRKLNQQRTAIYRIENGDVDPKLSTVINYLHGFGYHLEIVQDPMEIVEDYSEVHNKPNKNMVDFSIEINGEIVTIENIDKKKTKMSKKDRIQLMYYLLSTLDGDDE